MKLLLKKSLLIQFICIILYGLCINIAQSSSSEPLPTSTNLSVQQYNSNSQNPKPTNYTGGIGNIGPAGQDIVGDQSVSPTITISPTIQQNSESNTQNNINNSQINDQKQGQSNTNNVKVGITGAATSSVELKDDYFEINVLKGDQVELPQYNDKCLLFNRLSFLAKQDIKGKLYIQEGKKDNYKNFPNNNLDLVNGLCEIRMEGFDNNSLDKINLRTKYDKDFLINNNLSEDKLKLFIVENQEMIIDSSLLLKKVGSITYEKKTFNVQETELKKLPNAFAISTDKLNSNNKNSISNVNAIGTTKFGIPNQLYFILIPMIIVVAGIIWYRLRSKPYKAPTKEIREVGDFRRRQRMINW